MQIFSIRLDSYNTVGSFYASYYILLFLQERIGSLLGDTTLSIKCTINGDEQLLKLSSQEEAYLSIQGDLDSITHVLQYSCQMFVLYPQSRW